MDLTEINYPEVEEIYSFNPDLYIAASGYESRSIYMSGKLSGLNCTKVVLAYNDLSREMYRPSNDQFYRENDFRFFQCDGSVSPDFDSIFSQLEGESIKLMVDISVMTRVWFFNLLKYLHDLEDFSKIEMKITYCPIVYTEPVKIRQKIQLQKYSMIDFLNDNNRTNKDRALLLGLGIEKETSLYAYNTLNPDLTYLLYADPADRKEYVESIYINNHSLINQVQIKYFKGYPLNNVREIYRLLIDLILPIRENFNIVIVPQGPKIFALLSMILQISYPDIEMYCIRSKRRKIVDREISGEIISLDLIFEND